MFNAGSFPFLNHQFVVMTGQPDKYKNLKHPGQIEFTSESPAKLTDRFKSTLITKYAVLKKSICLANAS